MAAKKFKVVTVDFVNPADSPIGVVKDTSIASSAPTFNYGGAQNVGFAIFSKGFAGGGRNYVHTVLEIQMPESGDIEGFDEIIRTELILSAINASQPAISGSVATYAIVAATALSDNFDEGSLNGASGWCNWEQKIDGVVWSLGEGACQSRANIAEADGEVIDTIRFTKGSYVSDITFDLTEAIRAGEKKRFVFPIIQTDVSASAFADDIFNFNFVTKEYVSASPSRPILRVTYKDFSPEAFDSSDSALSIEPSPSNREFPLLKWGGVTEKDFVQFKVYRDTSPITSVATLTAIATISSPEDQEYVDETIATDGTDDGDTFYYLVIAEDTNNTGDEATFSKNVSFRKPNVSTFSVTPFGAMDVGDTITVTVGSAVKFGALYVDWKDGSTPWYVFETSGTSKSAEHTYSASFTSTALSARVEDELGFWSSLTNSVSTLSISDITPIPILIARPIRLLVGEKVYLNGSLSHPIASNAVISEYRFLVDGAPYAWQSSPFKEYTAPVSATYPYEVGFQVEVKTNGGLVSGVSAETTVTVDSNVATLLTFSRDTKITSRGEKRNAFYSTSPIQGGSGEVDVQSGLSNIEISLSGISSRVNMDADLTILKNAVANYSYVKILVKDEVCGSYIYYSGRIVGYTLNKTSERMATWTATMRVTSRT